MDRKQFFKELAGRAAGAVERALEGSKAGKTRDGLGVSTIDDARKRARPPGAYPQEERFLELCIGCDACMASCPVDAIMIEDLERRDPLLYPEENPCIECPGTPCITACPTGALARQFGMYLRGMG